MTFASRSDHAALRRFAYSLSWAFPLVFGLFLPWLFAYPWQFIIGPAPQFVLPVGGALPMFHYLACGLDFLLG